MSYKSLRKDIGEFNGEQLLPWQDNVKLYLRASGLTYLLGERPSSSLKVAEDSKAATWVELNDKMAAALSLCVSFQYRHLVQKCKTVQEVFDVLEGHLLGVDKASALVFKAQLTRHTFNDAKDLPSEFLKFEDMVERVVRLGETVSDKEKLCILRGALPLEYLDVLATYITNHVSNENALKYEAVKQHLTTFYVQRQVPKKKLSKEIKEEYNSEHALMGKKKKSRSKKTKKISNSSSSSGSDSSSSSSSSRGRGSGFVVKCWNCGHDGHTAIRCEKKLKPEVETKLREAFNSRLAMRPRVEETPKRSSSKSKSREASFFADGLDFGLPKETSLFASSLTRDKPSTARDWIVDSGCTTHVCNNLEQFDSFQRERVEVSTASKPVCGLGRGTVKIEARVGGEMVRLTLTDVIYIPSSPYNTISVSKLSAKGFYISTKDPALTTVCKRDNDSVWMECNSTNGLYLVKLWEEEPEASKSDRQVKKTRKPVETEDAEVALMAVDTRGSARRSYASIVTGSLAKQTTQQSNKSTKSSSTTQQSVKPKSS